MNFDMIVIKQHHLDRQQEITKSLQNARYEEANLKMAVSKSLERLGVWLSRLGERLQTEQKQRDVELVPIVQDRTRG